MPQRNPGALTKVPGNLPFSRLDASRNDFGGYALRDASEAAKSVKLVHQMRKVGKRCRCRTLTKML